MVTGRPGHSESTEGEPEGGSESAEDVWEQVQDGGHF
jgi:hypothetical protein